MSNIVTEHQIDLAQPTSNSANTLVTVCLSTWVIVISLLAQGGGWLAEQIFLALGFTWPWWAWAGIALGQIALLWLFLVPFGWRWHDERYRRHFQMWIIASFFLLFLIPIRFVALPTAQQTVVPQIGLSLLYGVGLLFFFRHPLRTMWPWNTHLIWLSVSLVMLLSFPWFAWGALGSLLDSSLNLIAGLVFGLVAAILLAVQQARTTPIAGTDAPTPGWVHGVLMGTTLLILASGLSVNGMQLLLMLILSSLGWVVYGLSRLADQLEGRPSLALAILVGFVAAAPQVWLDSDELVLILSVTGGEILGWAFFATFVSILLAWLLGTTINLTIDWQGWYSGLIGGSSALILGGIGLGIYLYVGQVGFYGDHLLVIYKDQADLSPAYEIRNIDERRRFVYETLLDQANQSQSELRAQLDQFAIPYQPYYLVNAIDVKGGPLIRLWLMRQPNVDRVLLNPMLRPLPAAIPMATGEASKPTELQWNLTLINAPQVWQDFGIRGEGVVIGQSDSGVDWTHPELQASYRGEEGQHNYHWLDPWNQTEEPVDIGGHGTHTLGSIVGQTVGVAPGATWFGCANLPRNLANPALYLDCMQFMLAPYPFAGDSFVDGDPSQSADVINNSWGCPDIEGCDETALLAGARALRAAGIFVVVSAGNEGPSCESIRDPLSLYDDVFSVGAVDEQGDIADFSSRGPVTVDGSGRIKPDIVAPGVEILSSFPGGTYSRTDGTSMAGPHVAGVVALVWSANPSLIGQIDQTETILRETSRPPEPQVMSLVEICSNDAANVIGSGLVDAWAAVQMALDLSAE